MGIPPTRQQGRHQEGSHLSLTGLDSDSFFSRRREHGCRQSVKRNIGLEPTTFEAGRRRSTTELIPRGRRGGLEPPRLI